MLTQINFDFGHPSASGVVALAGETVHVVPTGRFRSGKRIVVRDSFEVALSAEGKATVDVPPTDSTFAYQVTVGNDTNPWRFVRCVSVPNSSTAVDFADLPDVDSATLGPVDNNGSMVVFDMADSLEAAKALSARYPTHLVFYPDGNAKSVASQILEDLTDARATVEAQSTVAAQAANAARAASDASQAASAQVTAVADSISESKSVVESHANEALTAIDKAVKSVQDKASDATVEDKAKDKTSADATADTTSQEA